MKSWFTWLCSRSPWLALGVLAMLIVAVLASMHVITRNSYQLHMRWGATNALDLSPAR
jgi:hypothetical protein